MTVLHFCFVFLHLFQVLLLNVPRGMTELDKPVFPYDDPIRFAYLPQGPQTKSWSQLSPAGVGTTQNAPGASSQCLKSPRGAGDFRHWLVSLWVSPLAWHSAAKSRCPLWDASAFSDLVQLSGLLSDSIHWSHSLWLEKVGIRAQAVAHQPDVPDSWKSWSFSSQETWLWVEMCIQDIVQLHRPAFFLLFILFLLFATPCPVHLEVAKK